MTEPLLSVRDLSVAFTQGGTVTTAVNRISFDIAKGETVALVGESGSGKSVTALSVLKLLQYPAASHPSGQILFKGRDLLSATEDELRRVRGNDVTMIFQEPMTSLNPLHQVGRQIVEILMLHQGMGEAEGRKRAIELLTQVGIRDPESRIDSYPHQMSGGQRQRVMIAMALANRPELLIADEPTTALDVTVQAQILELLAGLKTRHGMSILFITHDLGIVRRFADRVCVMTKGEIVEQGPTAEVFAYPQHAYTRKLLDAEPKGRPGPVAGDAPPVIAADDVKVWFPVKTGFFRKVTGHIKAVDGVSVMVRAGETVGVVGESGSGKTTLGQAMIRLINSNGAIRFGDQSIDGLSFKQMRANRAAMQIVFQDPFGSLSPRMSVSEIIQEGLAIHEPRLSGSEREARVVEALTEVGLDPATRHRFPHEFSGGQRQRIAIARAMILKPRFVVLDEPTSALDMSVQAQVVELLRGLQEKYGLAYLFISHDLKVVRALAHQVVVMRNGVVVEAGSAEQIFDAPQTDYTKALMAAAFDISTAHQQAVNQ
ncbi:MAG: ABC transporter ATP-binding protein [Rhizobiaceae bacterium]|nr:ABC transporter ATP-binding protein [Rhizobiaceae bacterium]